MILFILSYVGGVLTILSPCILPVLPFVFARAEQPFVKSGLPLLLGMAATFAGVATLAAVGGGWAVQANEYGRWVALVVLALLGLTLLLPSLADRLTRPLVALGSRLSERSGSARNTVVASFVLGIATGLLWAPCAGPVLGLILTGAALNGANAQTSLLLFAYAAGAATSLAVALLIGGRVFQAMKRSLHAGEWIRRALGAAVLVGVVAIALGLDTGFLTQISAAKTAAFEQNLLDKFGMQAGDTKSANGEPVAMSGGPAMMSGKPAMTDRPAMSDNPAMMMSDKPAMAGGPAMMSGGPAMMADKGASSGNALPVEGDMPSLAGAVEWLNSAPLTSEALRGKVVLIDFWTYSCINCLRTIPYVRAWAEKYKDQGLVVIGVHTPEFAFEKKADNVRKATGDLKIGYPVAIDSDYAIWRAFRNHYWPAHYFIDAKGKVRYHHFGEGEYEQSEHVIQQLLAEAGHDVKRDVVDVAAAGAQAAPDLANVRSPETYVGYERADNFISPTGMKRDASHAYEVPARLKLNEWALGGNWKVEGEKAVSTAAAGRIAFRFQARDLHLVLGPGENGKPVRFRVKVDGQAPGDDHGMDIDAKGEGKVDSQRLYQLVRQRGPVRERLFEIEFLEAGAQAFAFTFG
ncbi:MAG TPA: cytochrome c biogenesis protein DipZ [Burkholderiales bacterium]|nr:cytochrome c biogenesis protein DipZ [Burkholderiales bacterium]